MSEKDRENQVLTLPDGRRLGFAEYGDTGGMPLIFFHGFPSSRLMFRLGDAPARDVGMRLIAPDRPGIGLSDFQPGRTIGAIADDVAALADHLGLEHFAVAGVSGGAPYAVACAVRLAARVDALAVISGMVPVGVSGVWPLASARLRFAFTVVRAAPGVVDLAFRLFRPVFARFPDQCAAVASILVGKADRATFANAAARGAMIASGLDAFANGARGPRDDLRLLAGDWDTDPAGVAAPVMLWHGEADPIVPVAMGRWLARRLPRCRATFLPEAGHFWIVDNAGAVLNELKSAVCHAAPGRANT
jgi:pimeloyl-ACP methyl ester carboxylesterase